MGAVLDSFNNPTAETMPAEPELLSIQSALSGNPDGAFNNLSVNNLITALSVAGALTMQGPLLFAPDATYNIGSASGLRPANIYAYGLIQGISLAISASVQFQNGLQPGYNNGVWGAIFAGTGVPANTIGANGDYYFRNDTPSVANQRIYVKIAGVWTGIL